MVPEHRLAEVEEEVCEHFGAPLLKIWREKSDAVPDGPRAVDSADAAVLPGWVVVEAGLLGMDRELQLVAVAALELGPEAGRDCFQVGPQ